MIILMTFWRAWHCRNEVTHHKPAPLVETSRRFLNGYIESLLCIKQYPKGDITKGKMVLQCAGQPTNIQTRSPHAETEGPRWMKPPVGWAKLNVDGSYVHGESTGGAGMVLRDDKGAVIFSSCRYLCSCYSPLEAELAACLEGIGLALAHTDNNLIIELDCKEAVDMLNDICMNRSAVASMVEEVKSLLHGIRCHKFVHAGRPCNAAAHYMAHMGRSSQRTAIWFSSGPEDLCMICETECRHTT